MPAIDLRNIGSIAPNGAGTITVPGNFDVSGNATGVNIGPSTPGQEVIPQIIAGITTPSDTPGIITISRNAINDPSSQPLLGGYYFANMGMEGVGTGDKRIAWIQGSGWPGTAVISFILMDTGSVPRFRGAFWPTFFEMADRGFIRSTNPGDLAELTISGGNTDQGGTGNWIFSVSPLTDLKPATLRISNISSTGAPTNEFISIDPNTRSIELFGTISAAELPNADPGAGTKQLWYDPSDGNRVKFSP